MSMNEHETHAAVVAEMRKSSNEAICPWWADGGDCANCPLGGAGKNCPFDKFADRIEAAWKREREEAEADALAVGGIVEANRELQACKEAVLDFCAVFTFVYPPNDGDCPAVLAGAFELLKDAMGIETIITGKGGNDGNK